MLREDWKGLSDERNVTLSSSVLSRFHTSWIFPVQPGCKATSTGHPSESKNSLNALECLQELICWDHKTDCLSVPSLLGDNLTVHALRSIKKL